DLAVGQKGSGVTPASCNEIASVTPRLSGWVVEFCAVALVIATASAPRHQDLAVRQQRRGMKKQTSVETAGATPCPFGRVVQLRSVEKIIIVEAPRNQDLPVRQQRRGVILTGGA